MGIFHKLTQLSKYLKYATTNIIVFFEEKELNSDDLIELLPNHLHNLYAKS